MKNKIKTKTRIFYIRESLFQSILSDLFTFGSFFILITINYKFWKGEWFVTLTLVIMWFVMVSARSSKNMKRFNNNKELIEYLDSEDDLSSQAIQDRLDNRGK